MLTQAQIVNKALSFSISFLACGFSICEPLSSAGLGRPFFFLLLFFPKLGKHGVERGKKSSHILFLGSLPKSVLSAAG